MKLTKIENSFLLLLYDKSIEDNYNGPEFSTIAKSMYLCSLIQPLVEGYEWDITIKSQDKKIVINLLNVYSDKIIELEIEGSNNPTFTVFYVVKTKTTTDKGSYFTNNLLELLTFIKQYI